MPKKPNVGNLKVRFCEEPGTKNTWLHRPEVLGATGFIDLHNRTYLSRTFNMQQLPFYPHDVLYGLKPGIGLCTLWTPKIKYKSILPYVQIIGNLYSNFGIGLMIRNVLAVPQIQHIVITGMDVSKNLMMPIDRLLNHSLNSKELFLEESQIQEFYERVKIHDKRMYRLHDMEDLIIYLKKIRCFKSKYKPLLIPLPNENVIKNTLFVRECFFSSNSIKEIHPQILREVRNSGYHQPPDSNGQIRQELWQITVNFSVDMQWTEVPFYSHEEIVAYGESLWCSATNEELNTYGPIMRNRGVDQVQQVLDLLRNKKHTNKALITLWNETSSTLEDPPCLAFVHLKLNNNDELDMFAYIRSSELFKAWPMDVAGLRYFQNKIADQLQVKPGRCVISSGSAHIYERYFAGIDAYLAATCSSSKFTSKNKVDFRFAKQDDVYIAEIYTKGNLIHRFEEKSVKFLEAKILPHIRDISHAVYIGKELQKLSEQQSE